MKRQHIFLMLTILAAVAAVGVAHQRRAASARGESNAVSSRTEAAAPTPIANGVPTSSNTKGVRPAEGSAARTDGTAPGNVEGGAQALRLGLASDSAAARIAAVEKAVSTTALDALPVLEDFALERDPETAPTVIHATALLGASADDRARDRAARTLGSWLRTETKRDGLDALGNVPNLVEALGDIGGAEAVLALTAALDSKTLPLHVETLATMKLGELADAKARGAVERFGARVATLPASDGLEEELRVEAIDAARTTLARL